MQVYDNQNEPAVLMVLKSIFIKYTPSNFFEHMQSTQHALQKNILGTRGVQGLLFSEQKRLVHQFSRGSR